MQTHTLHRLTQAKPNRENTLNHKHTQEHKQTSFIQEATLASHPSGVFFPSKYPEQSTFGSEPTPLTITRHIRHINFVHHEIYWFAKKPPIIYSSGEMHQS